MKTKHTTRNTRNQITGNTLEKELDDIVESTTLQLTIETKTTIFSKKFKWKSTLKRLLFRAGLLSHKLN